MKKILALAAFGALLWAHPGHAAVSRSFLMQSCTAKDQAKLAGCDAYVAGVLETVQTLQNDKALDRKVCVPEKITLRQTREGVVNYLQTHGSEGGEAATPAVLGALRALYRCP